MGSGHILVYLFDVLMQIYDSQGWTKREAVRSILENNLYGLDIDERAAQLAYFAVMMKARYYDRRFFSRQIEPMVYYPADYPEGQEYGSLLVVNELEPEPDLDSWQIGDGLYEHALNRWKFRSALHQKYHVVVTNPPYMGGSGMGPELSKFVKDVYPDSKGDMSTVFMEKTMFMCKENGYMSMINIPVWMFLSSYEKLRKKLLDRNTLTSMVHPGRGIFGSDFGTTTFVFQKGRLPGYQGSYRRLFDVQGEVKSNEEREKALLTGKGQYTAKQDNFAKIPGEPVAYWVSEKVAKDFLTDVISKYGWASKGIITGDNARFLRLWYEISNIDIFFDANSLDDAIASKRKWYPCNKGGDYRKWYGNNGYVIYWLDNGNEIMQRNTIRVRNCQDYRDDCKFIPSITWTSISSSKSSFRLSKKSISESAGMTLFVPKNLLFYTMAFLNTKAAEYLLSVLNPTLNFTAGSISNLPLIISEEMINNVEGYTSLCVKNEEADWDSFETSWDFQCHPLVRSCPTVEAAFHEWETECNQRFNQLKANEEELNRIFIDLYGLQDELTPEVEDRDVTVRKADLQRDIRSLISYAVGCMFGRYSLDVNGLAYAGGAWDAGKYTSFQPDPDNCIPITDEAYFEDDIVGRFVEFIRVVYGADTLNENLAFIAKALGNKGNSSREIIRNYFLKDFFKDHCKIYQKRPIYWLFDSGKQNGFKALVYLHRWNADTVGNLRVEYLHRVQKVYEREIQRMQDTMDNSRNNREVNQAAKRREKLVKQLKEARDYDARIAHVALSRVDIDLDDGVKVNYQKVQKGPDGKSLGILAKI